MSTRPGPEGGGPLAGVRVLITRTAGDADPLRKRLEELGASVWHLPTIEIEPPEDWAPLDEALRHIDSYHYVVFTSRNAVETVFERLPLVGFPDRMPEWPDGPEVVAAGEVTARLLHSLGVDTLMRPDHQNTQGVAAAILEDNLHGRSVLYPTSDLARPHLKQQLEEAGARVDQIVAYRTVRPKDTDAGIMDDLRQGRFDVITVASPSAVQNLKAILEPEWSCLRLARFVCIGHTTAWTAQDEGLDPMAVAREPSVDGMVDAILSLYAAEGLHDD